MIISMRCFTRWNMRRCPINKPMYGLKGREVLAGKPVDISTVPNGLTAFKEALEKYYPRR
jgi:hypothetical protein